MRIRYGISLEEYRAMEKEQGSVCAICNQSETAKGFLRLSVDHCHETGEVRGLLCANCNRMIGMAKDDPAILEAAIRYLK